MLRLGVLALAILAAGCASGGEPPTAPAAQRTSDYRPSQLRLTAVTVRVVVGRDAAVSERERTTLPGLYEGILVEGLNERALVVRDVRALAAPEPPAMAAARARDVGADHAVVVEVRIEPELVRVCEETRRPLRGHATVFKQQATVVRASDGVVRATHAVDVPAVEADCEAERPRAQVRSAGAAAAGAVERLLARLLEP